MYALNSAGLSRDLGTADNRVLLSQSYKITTLYCLNLIV